MVFKHECQFCGYEWQGRKKNVISCPRCKRRVDYPSDKVPGKQAALRFVEFNLIRAGLPPTVAREEAKFRLQEIIQRKRK